MKIFYVKINNKMIKVKRKTLIDIIEQCKNLESEWVIYSQKFKRLAYKNDLYYINKQLWNFKF